MELLGGNGVDTSKMFPVADLCFSLSGLGESSGDLWEHDLPYSCVTLCYTSLKTCLYMLRVVVLIFSVNKSEDSSHL